jgi:hypothetical protein
MQNMNPCRTDGLKDEGRKYKYGTYYIMKYEICYEKYEDEDRRNIEEEI